MKIHIYIIKIFQFYSDPKPWLQLCTQQATEGLSDYQPGAWSQWWPTSTTSTATSTATTSTTTTSTEIQQGGGREPEHHQRSYGRLQILFLVITYSSLNYNYPICTVQYRTVQYSTVQHDIQNSAQLHWKHTYHTYSKAFLVGDQKSKVGNLYPLECTFISTNSWEYITDIVPLLHLWVKYWIEWVILVTMVDYAD